MASVTVCARFTLVLLCSCSLIRAIDADWGPWGGWSTCTVTCGNGVRTRERSCDGGVCSGMSYSLTTCSEPACDDNSLDAFKWSPWGDWSACSRTCGGGHHVRTRSCSSGNVTECCDGTDPETCPFEYRQTRECINDDCIGSWGEWRPWGECSSSCGEGTQTRHRHCEPEDTVCYGGAEQTRTCYVQCLQQERMIAEMDSTYTCSPNPCQNNGLCASNGGGVLCICSGNWRGRDCSNLCLDEKDPYACSNKEGIFHSCTNCSQFIICFRGTTIPMSCTDRRIWTGDGCELPEQTRVLCLT